MIGLEVWARPSREIVTTTVRMRDGGFVRFGEPEPEGFVGVDVCESARSSVLFGMREDFRKIQLFIQCITARKNMATRAEFFCFRVEFGRIP